MPLDNPGVKCSGSRELLCDSIVVLIGSLGVWQVVYRTLGYSGADIRNLINEAGIMAVSLFD